MDADLDAVARTVDAVARREEAEDAPGRTTEAVAAASMVKTVADMIDSYGWRVCLVVVVIDEGARWMSGGRERKQSLQEYDIQVQVA